MNTIAFNQQLSDKLNEELNPELFSTPGKGEITVVANEKKDLREYRIITKDNKVVDVVDVARHCSAIVLSEVSEGVLVVIVPALYDYVVVRPVDVHDLLVHIPFSFSKWQNSKRRQSHGVMIELKPKNLIVLYSTGLIQKFRVELSPRIHVKFYLSSRVLPVCKRPGKACKGLFYTWKYFLRRTGR